MCGIAGVLDQTGTRSPDALAHIAQTMAATLGHRGPDDGGVWADPSGRIALGFRRLAVVDPGATGSQPMRSPSGRYVAVFNGEVYGYERLRDQLDTVEAIQIGECLDDLLHVCRLVSFAAKRDRCQIGAVGLGQ